MAGSCERAGDPLGSIKCGEFLGWPRVPLVSQEELCLMELVMKSVKDMCRRVIEYRPTCSNLHQVGVCYKK